MSPCNNATNHWRGTQSAGQGGIMPQQGRRRVIVQMVLDATESMERYLRRVVAAMLFFVDELTSSNLEPVFCLTIFRDEIEGEMPEIGPLGMPPEKIKDILKNTRTQGGGSIPESALPAIWKTLDVAEHETDQKVLFLLTDAPCHNPESGISAQGVAARLAQKQVLFFACSPKIQPYTDFVTATGGLLFPITPDMDADSFKAMLSALTATTVKTMRMAETKRLMDGVSADLKTKLMR